MHVNATNLVAKNALLSFYSHFTILCMSWTWKCAVYSSVVVRNYSAGPHDDGDPTAELNILCNCVCPVGYRKTLFAMVHE